MSSDTIERVTVDKDTEQQTGRLRGLVDTLQDGFSQTVETVTRQSRFEIGGSLVDQIDAPEDLDEFVDKAKDVGFVWKALRIFASDVWEPGFRLTGPDETVQYFMGEIDDRDASPPEDTPEGGFLDNAAVFAGEKHQDFYDFGKQTTFQRRLRGTVLIELLKADDTDPESEITGFYFIRPETVSAEVYPNTNILIDPEDTDQPGVETTKRGEAAAFIQFDDESILGRRGVLDKEREDEVHLSQNDVHKQTLYPSIGDDAGQEQGVFGTSEIEPISQDIAEYLQIKRDRKTAISNKAYGVFFIEHGREVLDLGNQKEVIEWDDSSMDDFEDDLSNLEPGGYVTHDGSVGVERKTGDVPDVSDPIDHYVQSIISSLPVPKYKIGFEDNVNRDVTSEQNSDYERIISEEREYQERQWTQVLRTVANRKGLPTEGLQLKIEPEPSDSPVMSLTTEEMNKLATYADALNSLAGPQGGPQTLVDTETLLTDVAQLPESVASVDDMAEAMGETNPDAMQEFRDIMASGSGNGNDVDDRLDALESKIDALFDPVKHPRNPDTGKFVERPYDVPDEISGLDTEQVIGELAAANENFTEQVEDIAVDVPGDDDGPAVPTEIQELADTPNAGSGGSVEGIEDISFSDISEGDVVRANGKLIEVEGTSDRITGQTVRGHLFGESKTQSWGPDTNFESAGPIPESDDFPRTNIGSGPQVEIRGLTQTEHGPKIKVDSPFEAKDAIKELDFDETHRSWNSDTETWDIDLDATDTVIEKLRDDFELQINNEILREAGLENQIES